MPPLSEASHRRAKEILDGFSRVGEVLPGSILGSLEGNFNHMGMDQYLLISFLGE